MTEREMELAKRASEILGKDVIRMNLNDIIDELMAVIENGRVSNAK
jgi:hypothetical protein